MSGDGMLDAVRLILSGAFGSPASIAAVLTAWAPLLLCSAGLLVTFEAGLWNIGIEGQVVVGAIAATGVLRAGADVVPPGALLVVAAVTAACAAALWAALVAWLRQYGHVNEIFGGLGLNFMAGAGAVYLILGPWKRAGVGSTSGTEPFAPALWLPAPAAFRVSPIEMLLAFGAMALVVASLRGTFIGLGLKATGSNPRAAFVRGLPTARLLLGAFAACGACAGLAGFILLVGAGARHTLYPLISSGYGFLGILVVLVAVRRPMWTMIVSFLFAVVAMGGLQLALERQLDSSVAGVIQGVVVLVALVIQGLRGRRAAREGAVAA